MCPPFRCGGACELAKGAASGRRRPATSGETMARTTNRLPAVLPASLHRLGVLAASLALAGVASAQKICMTADLDGAQETPPNGSAAKGTAVCVLDRDANTLTFTLV